jgi:hypothetical protein
LINDALCDCIAQLVKVDDIAMEVYIFDFLGIFPLAVDVVGGIICVLDHLCSLELSEKLVTSLQAIYENIPELRRVVQQKVLNILSIVLQGFPYQHPGAPVVCYYMRRNFLFIHGGSLFCLQLRESRVVPTKLRDRKSSARAPDIGSLSNCHSLVIYLHILTL